MSKPTIEVVAQKIDRLANLQDKIVNSFFSQIQNVRAERAATEQELEIAARSLVSPDDSQRYARLSRAAQEAGIAANYEALARQWTNDDEQNRLTRASLEGKWGALDEIEEKRIVRKAQLDVVTEALEKTQQEIEVFEDSRAKINEHNETYPKYAITEEPQQGFKSSSFGNKMTYYLIPGKTGNGHHSAYLALTEYKEEFGVDYYEQAKAVKKLRDQVSSLEEQHETAQQAYEEADAGYRQMKELDRAYKGPEGIAEEIRGRIKEALAKNYDFAKMLCERLKTPEALGVALAIAKIRALQDLEENAGTPYVKTKNTLGHLREPEKTLEEAIEKVGRQYVDFDIEKIENAVEKAAVVSRRIIKDVGQALAGINGYQVAENVTFAQLQKDVRALAAFEVGNNTLDIDMDGLKLEVSRNIQSFDASQSTRVKKSADAYDRAKNELRGAFAQVAVVHNNRTGAGNDSDILLLTDEVVATAKAEEEKAAIEPIAARLW